MVICTIKLRPDKGVSTHVATVTMLAGSLTTSNFILLFISVDRQDINTLQVPYNDARRIQDTCDTSTTSRC
jgi:hypothetical protein